jgi:hypothetical protein
MRRITVKVLMQDDDGKSREYVHEAEVDGEPDEKEGFIVFIIYGRSVAR